MIVSELIEHLKKMPQDFQVVYSDNKDDNFFLRVERLPRIGWYHDALNDFHVQDRMPPVGKVMEHSVCIN